MKRFMVGLDGSKASAAALRWAASARDADLIVLGTRGAGGFAGLRFGGVAMKVLHRASLPLVLVPPTGS